MMLEPLPVLKKYLPIDGQNRLSMLEWLGKNRKVAPVFLTMIGPPITLLKD